MQADSRRSFVGSFVAPSCVRAMHLGEGFMPVLGCMRSEASEVEDAFRHVTHGTIRPDYKIPHPAFPPQKKRTGPKVAIHSETQFLPGCSTGLHFVCHIRQ
jgi:hypothetical protein